MAFSSLADELNLDSGFPMSPSGPGLSLADEFGDMGGGKWDTVAARLETLQGRAPAT